MAGCIPETVTLGIDEAGRGPILGPLVMAGVVLKPRAAARLSRRGVTDSKSYGAGPDAHAQRKALLPFILEYADSVETRVIHHDEVDRRVAKGELNVLEREHATDIIGKSAPCHRIIADGARMFRPLVEQFPHLVARDKAEAFHVAVAAASLVAKVERDEHFHRIAARYEPEFGPISGGGYLNAGTTSFLRAYVGRYGKLPAEARLSWNWRMLPELFPDGTPNAEG